jgi:hypothetical protein
MKLKPLDLLPAVKAIAKDMRAFAETLKFVAPGSPSDQLFVGGAPPDRQWNQSTLTL